MNSSYLYTEVYLICIIVAGLVFHWIKKYSSDSASENWLRLMVIWFQLNFLANLCFTLVNSFGWLPFLFPYASYFFKSLYHLGLCMGVFCWCGLAEAERQSRFFEDPKSRLAVLGILAFPIGAILANLFTKSLFEITAQREYIRHWLFQVEMGYLLILSSVFAVLLLRHSRTESDPVRRGNMRQTATFPLCILAAWILSFIGEQFPVICVAMMLELICLYVGTSNQQISLDKLTQVNNRQNLMAYLDYKIVNHEEMLYLMMIDVDYFKSINDTYGHLEGDDALILVSRALKAACVTARNRPYIARFGGDEFIVILEATKEEIEALRDKIQATLKRMVKDAGKKYPLTVSIGVGRFSIGMNSEQFMAAADEALYVVKEGREKR